MAHNTLDRKQRREEYEKVLRIVEHQTGGKQPALAKRSSVIGVAKQTGMDARTATKRLRAARENGDVVRIRDRVVRATEANLKAAVGELNGDLTRLAAALEEVDDD